MTPLVSICIPTYNHAGLLEQMLTRLTCATVFANGQIEVVISDNASTDTTQLVGERFAAAHPNRVIYYRNPENIHDANFALALSRGRGVFLKLANDTLLFSDEGLREICSTVSSACDDKPILFFSNQGPAGTERRCQTLDELIDEISFRSTWIGSFGIWKSDFDKLPDFARYQDLQLTQVDALLRTMSIRRNALVNHVVFAESLPRKSVGGYNLAQVFGRNYFALLSPYVKSGELSNACLRREKFRMLRYHILPFYLSFSRKFAFPSTGYIRFLLSDYWSSPFYWATLPFVLLTSLIKRLMAFPFHGPIVMG